jgi:hypothetical protein
MGRTRSILLFFCKGALVAYVCYLLYIAVNNGRFRHFKYSAMACVLDSVTSEISCPLMGDGKDKRWFSLGGMK